MSEGPMPFYRVDNGRTLSGAKGLLVRGSYNSQLPVKGATSPISSSYKNIKAEQSKEGRSEIVKPRIHSTYSSVPSNNNNSYGKGIKIGK